MNGLQIITYAVLGAGVVALLWQWHQARRFDQRERRIQEQWKTESKALLEFINLQWRRPR